MTEKRNVRRISLFITFFIVLCTLTGIIPINNTAHAATIYGFVPENFWWDIDSEGNAAIMGVNLGTTKGDIKIPTTLAGGQGPYYIASGTTSPGGSYVGTSGKTYKVTKIHGGYGMYASGGYYTEFGAFSPLSPVNAGNCYANNITGVQFPAQGTIISTDATNLFQAGDPSASASQQSSLTKVTNFPDSYTNLTSAFENCTKLVTGPELGANVTTATNAFKNCTSLKKLVVYSKSVDMSSAFPGCSDINLYCYKDSAADKAVAGVSDRTYFGEIYTDPPAAVEASVGDSVTVQAQYISDKTNRLTSSVAATWQVNNDGVWEDIDTNVSNTTSSHIGTATLTIPDVTLADNGKQFRLYSTDGGSVSEYSSIVTLQIEYGSSATDFVWEFDDAAKTAKVIGYIGNGGDVIVPLSVTGTGEAYGNEYGEYTLGTAGITYTVTDIGRGAFSLYENEMNVGCADRITSVYLPDTLTSTSAEAWFSGCLALENVYGLPDTLKTMYQTFYDCMMMKTAPEIPDSVTEMEETFYACTALEEAPTLPTGVTNLSGCFQDCSSLTKAPAIPGSVTKMYDTFYGCTSLQEAPAIPENVNDMSGVFYGCTELSGQNITIYASPAYTRDMLFRISGVTLNCYKDSGIDSYAQENPETVSHVKYFGDVLTQTGDITINKPTDTAEEKIEIFVDAAAKSTYRIMKKTNGVWTAVETEQDMNDIIPWNEIAAAGRGTYDLTLTFSHGMGGEYAIEITDARGTVWMADSFFVADYDDFIYEYDDTNKTAKVIGYRGTADAVLTVPSVTTKDSAVYTVTDLKHGTESDPTGFLWNDVTAQAGGDLENLEQLILPDSITSTNADYWFANGKAGGLTSGLNVQNLPETLTSMRYTFKNAQVDYSNFILPPHVKDLTGCFSGTTMNQIVAVPDSVRNMDECFMGATFLLGESFTWEIPERVESMIRCFADSSWADMGTISLYNRDADVTFLFDESQGMPLSICAYKNSQVKAETIGEAHNAAIKYFGDFVKQPQDVDLAAGDTTASFLVYLDNNVPVTYTVLKKSDGGYIDTGIDLNREIDWSIPTQTKEFSIRFDDSGIGRYKIQARYVDGTTWDSAEFAVKSDTMISVVVPTKVVFEIDPNMDGAGYTDAATGLFSNTGGCDVELSVADISGQNGAPITAYNKYSQAG